FINRRNDLHVSPAQLARHWRVASAENTVGEVVHLRRLLIDRREVQRAAAGFSHDAAIGKGVLLEFNPTLGAFGAKSIGAVIETGNRIASGPVPKLHRPAAGFFDFFEQSRFWF